MRMRQTLADRFWSKVDKRGPDECWLWRSAVSKNGYGAFGIGKRGHFGAHRIAWELTNGRIPRGGGSHGTCVCHRCDNPLCVNPAHLWLGSCADNLRDMRDKGRQGRGEVMARRGEANGFSKLTEQLVRDIRANYVLCRVTQRELALRFSVGRSTISYIINGKLWPHVAVRRSA
jgi:DNA-binding XRE family transcriptional regulator